MAGAADARGAGGAADGSRGGEVVVELRWVYLPDAVRFRRGRGLPLEVCRGCLSVSRDCLRGACHGCH